MTVRQSRAEFDEKVGRERYHRSLSFDKICVTLSVIIYHIFNHYSDYLEDMRERKVETNSEAQKLIDEIQKFTTSYMNTIQSHCDKLIEKVQKNRALKIQKVEEVISEIEQLENETESTLDIRFVLRARSWSMTQDPLWTMSHGY